MKASSPLSFLTPWLLLAVMVCPLLRAQDTPTGDWRRALPGSTYHFPADHESHPDYKTEWWYFTGNLKADDGHEYGYELTFFRKGVLAPGQRTIPTGTREERSRFVQNDFKFAHFAVTDLSKRRFNYTQKMSRGAFGEAGFAPLDAGTGRTEAKPFVWLEDWTLTAQPDGSWRIRARTDDPVAMAIDLRVDPRKAPVIEGTDGVSQKSAGLGNASYYYSFTRMDTEGSLSYGSGEPKRHVRGESWFDHEWASNQLGPDQIGWNWFCIQFDDQTEVMLYAMRRRDGSVDPVSSGTYIDSQGASKHLRREDFRLEPQKTWRSPKTGGVYPLVWKVAVPALGIEGTVRARVDEQELALPQISYWEGATEIVGTRSGTPLTGRGYMELTGYAGQLFQLQPRRENSASNLRTPPR